MTDTNKASPVEAYIAASEAFAQPILRHLRQLVLATCPEAVEEIKWGIPHFSVHGEYLCMLAAAKKHCAFTFWKQEIMSDPRLRANPGLPAIKRYLGKLTSLADLPEDAELIGFIREAAALNEKGIKLPARPAKTPARIEMPDYFAARLDTDSRARSVWDSKSDSFRKEYLVWITDAKTEATREKRMAEALEWIGNGKSRFWKYAK